MLQQQLKEVWEHLRAKRAHLRYFLEEVRIEGLRGIDELRVRFNYPVSVLAGPNACGKSTVLSALACAYKVPHRAFRDYLPSTMFPDFSGETAGAPSDPRGEAAIEFYYIHDDEHYRMRWSRGKQWNRTFPGLPGGKQPQRVTHFSTLENLANPSRVRSVLQMGRLPTLQQEIIGSDRLRLAERVLPWRYRELVLMRHKGKDFLFAHRKNDEGASYSEFHMSAAERAILRLSKDLGDLEGSMILIDEVEASMHPFTQQQLMLELQRLALRNDLQIVVATHSPVILDTVPPEGRIFLDRLGGTVTVLPPYRDLIQKSLYGGSIDKLSILCEDEVAESLIRGTLEVINPRLGLSPSDLELGRDAGKNEFPQHVRALAKFNRLFDFIFVLDGDARELEDKVRGAGGEYGPHIRLLFLPGETGPESWVWERLEKHASEYGTIFGVAPEVFNRLCDSLDQAFAGASGRPAGRAKGRLSALAGELARDVGEICRAVGRREAERGGSEMRRFLADLEDAIKTWRKLLQDGI